MIPLLSELALDGTTTAGIGCIASGSSSQALNRGQQAAGGAFGKMLLLRYSALTGEPRPRFGGLRCNVPVAAATMPQQARSARGAEPPWVPGAHPAGMPTEPVAGFAPAAELRSPAHRRRPRHPQSCFRCLSASGGERKHLTMLFADIRNSTELIATIDPEQAMRRMQPALDAMKDAVHRYHGIVSKVQGDGVMALFGAPRHFSHGSAPLGAHSLGCESVRPWRRQTDQTSSTQCDAPERVTRLPSVPPHRDPN
jgi:hypothetical protein